MSMVLLFPSSTPPPVFDPSKSTWQKPTNQPYKYRVKRQQPLVFNSPYYGIPVASTVPSVSSWKRPTSQPVRLKRCIISISGGKLSDVQNITVTIYPTSSISQPKIIKKRQQPINKYPFPPTPSQAPYLSYWVKPTNQPQRRNRRIQPQYTGFNPFYGIVTTTTPLVSSWEQAPSKQLRNSITKRQQPIVKPIPFYGIPVTGTVLVSQWTHLVNQPLRNKVTKRQQPVTGAAPLTQGSQAPYVSYWKQPVNNPLKSRLPKRLQLPKIQPPYPAIPSAPPYLSYWVHLTNQPLRRVKRQQPQIFLGGTLYAANTVVVPAPFGFQQPVNQPLKSRVIKRLQIGRVYPFPALASAPPYLSYWKQPISQPYLRPKRRLINDVKVNPFYGITIVTVPTVSSWKRPTVQPRINIKRQQILRTSGWITVIPTNSWVKPTNQPLRRTRRSQTQYIGFNSFYGITTSTTPTVSSWKQPVSQQLRSRISKRQQPNYNKVPPTIGSQAPYLSYWKLPVNQPLNKRISKRLQVNKATPPLPPPASASVYASMWVHLTNQPLRSRISNRQQPQPPKPAFPPLASQSPYLSYWVHLTNQPLNNRKPKRLQVNRQFRIPLIANPIIGFNFDRIVRVILAIPNPRPVILPIKSSTIISIPINSPRITTLTIKKPQTALVTINSPNKGIVKINDPIGYIIKGGLQ